MPTVPKVKPAAAVIPRQRRGTPAFRGDVAELAGRLRAEAGLRPDGDCVLAIIWIEAIQEERGLSAARRVELTAAVLEAVGVVRGWDAPLAGPVDHPLAGEYQPDERPPVAPAEPVHMVYADGGRLCGGTGPGSLVWREVTCQGCITELHSHEPSREPAASGRDVVVSAAGDVAELAERLQAAEAARPDGSCVEAIVLIEAIHAGDAPPAEKVRLTGAVLAAVRAARGWTP